MNNFKKTFGFLVLAIFIIGSSIIVIKPEAARPAPGTVGSNTNPSPTMVKTGNNSSGTASSQGYTLAEVATHNSGASCWTAINGEVYDVTPFIDQHPGGSGAILSLCGIDGSEAFNNQHGGQRRPANELAGFKIGALKN